MSSTNRRILNDLNRYNKRKKTTRTIKIVTLVMLNILLLLLCVSYYDIWLWVIFLIYSVMSNSDFFKDLR